MEEPDLDWGPATPEGYNDANHEALHVLNVNFVGEENRNRVLRFVLARILHFARHLPKGSSQRVRFDFRGQFASHKNLAHVRGAISQFAAKHGINVSVEF